MKSKSIQSLNIVLIFSIALIIGGSITHAILGQSWTSTSGHAIGSDDAYISFRYAENLFSGNGLVFNVGEYVEGYSNLLYILLVTPSFLLGKDYVYAFSLLINCVLLAVSLYIFWRFTRETIGLRSANIGVFLLAANPWIWANAATGLETILILFATLGLWVSTEKHKESGSTGFFILILFFSLICILGRVDGFIPPLISALYIFIKKSKKDGIRMLFFVSVCMAIYTIFRFFYYDDFIANTFYNKVSGGIAHRLSRGLAFLGQNLIKTGLVIALLALYYHFLKKNPAESSLEKTSFAALFIFLWISYLVYIGGDIYYERFIVPIIPMIIYVGLSSCDDFKKPHLYIVCAAFLSAPIYYASKDGRFDWSDNKYDMWVRLGRYLSKAPQGSSLAIDAAGKVPFFSGLPTIDMLGLNDKHIGKLKPISHGMPGHEKFDPDYVLGKAPTYIAAWINPDLDMAWGLAKEKYLENYNLKYLINSSRNDLGERNIIDVSSLEVLDIKNLVQNGYNYGVLLKKENSNDLGQLALYIDSIKPGHEYRHDSKEVLFSGWSYPEAEHRWTSGHSSKIIFIFNHQNQSLEGELVLNFFTLGKQHIELSINGVPFFSGVFDGATEGLSIPIPKSILKNGVNSLQFFMPDARQPGNGDQRVLALALKSFKIR